ncbi:phenylpyruvate tautomerase PptA (4-oxalocrotonate tautomerase family) [Neobacillus sp. B4I6]|uniref:hypothetical protein n=1 Tax=Neobacillus sp. B4I6 TaxID=3373925 RepID=UPI003D203FB6
MKNSLEDPHQVITSTSEQKAIGKIEAFYLRNQRRSIYIALEEVEDADFFWGRTEIKEFDFWWKKDTPLTKIAYEMERTETAVLLLALDRVMKGKIKPRDGWRIW